MEGPQVAKLPIPHNGSFRRRRAPRKPGWPPNRSGYGYRTIRSHFRRPGGHLDHTAGGSQDRGPAATPQTAKYG